MRLKGPQTSEVIESLLPLDAQTLIQPCLQWSSGLCLNTSVMGNARSGQAALPTTTSLRPLESSSSLNKPPCGSPPAALVQPSGATRRNLTPLPGKPFLCSRMGEHVLASQLNTPSSFSCALWHSLQSVPYHGILPLPTNTPQIVK